MRAHFILPIFLGVLCFGFVSSIRADDSTGDQSPEVIQAWTHYHKLDGELTALYQKILIALESKESREKFTESENAWLKFREAQGAFEAEGAPGQPYSKQRMCASFTATTEARIAELKKWEETAFQK